MSAFCPCCVVNQLYQTTSQKGNPTTDGGKEFNTNNMLMGDCNFGACMYACFCMPCSIGTFLQDSVGMPFLLGCCFFNLFNAKNVLRYHYRLRSTAGSDCMEECFLPYLMYCCANLLALPLSMCCPCLYACVFTPLCGAVIALDMALLKEAATKRGGENKAYLRGYSPNGPTSGGPTYVTYVNLPPNAPYVGSKVSPSHDNIPSAEAYPSYQPVNGQRDNQLPYGQPVSPAGRPENVSPYSPPAGSSPYGQPAPQKY